MASIKKPFQVIRINTKPPVGSHKELIAKLVKATDPVERTKLMQNMMYPNILKSTEE